MKQLRIIGFSALATLWLTGTALAQNAEPYAPRDSVRAITHPLSHSSYLINLASPDDALWEKSTKGMVIELLRAEQLAIPYVVVHPGSHITSSEEEGIARVALALDMIHKLAPRAKSQVLLEITAGQGTNLGWKFSHLAAILAQTGRPDRVGICFDTCHAFAAGHDLSTDGGYDAVMADVDRSVGLGRLRAVHLNDSVLGLGSRRDRHANLGEGVLGRTAFRRLVNDERLAEVPMVLETPGGTEGYRRDLRILRRYRTRPKTAAAPHAR